MSSRIADRLAAPVLSENPSQADLGAYAYWEYCLPCHGDRGQGLTEEFRELYPPEDRNCWDSGCHGPRPYDNGWTLPASVPALIGPERLTRFDTAAALQAFVQAAMPWHNPGSLDEITTWQITAHLLRSNGVPLPPNDLGPENALDVPLRRDATPTATPSTQPAETVTERYRAIFVALGILLMLGLWARLERRQRKSSRPK
jgi:cytochrome c